MSDRKNKLVLQLKDLFGEVTGEDLHGADQGASFVDLGLDSLILTQVSQSVQGKFGVKVTFRQIMNDLSSLDALAGFIDGKMAPDVPAPPANLPTVAPVPVIQAASVAAAPNPVPAAIASLPLPAVAPPTAFLPSPLPSGEGGAVERVVRQQLQLMTQQLALLQRRSPSSDAGVSPVLAAPPSLAVQPAAVTTPARGPVIKAVKSDGDEKKRFGPFKGIEKGPSGGLTPRQEKALAALIERYNRRTAKSKEYAQRYRKQFCDPRAAGNFRQLWKEMVYPLVCAKSKGAKIWDLDGNEYLDVTTGFGANYLGHSPDFVMRALDEQLKLGVEIGPQSPLAGELARMICEITGSERATFCNTGSEAVMAAIRVSRTVTGRNKIVYFHGDYHGIFDEVLGRPALVDDVPGAMAIAPGIPHLANVMVLEYGSPAALETIKAHYQEIAAVLVEPVQARHPDLQPREFLHELRRVTEAHEIALVFDEVITGFRVAPGGAQEYFGIKADLGTYGKIAGGGMPIGVLAGKAKYMDALDGGFWQYGDDSSPPTGVTFFAGTFVRHPLAMAAGLAVMRFLKERGPSLQRETNERTARFVSAMNAFFEERRLPMRLQGFSALFFYDFHPDLKYAPLLFYYMRDRGVHIWEGRVGQLTIEHTDQDMEFLLGTFKASVAEMQEDGFLPVSDGTSSPPDKPADTGNHPSSAVASTPGVNGAAAESARLELAPAQVVDEAKKIGPAATTGAPQQVPNRFPLAEGQMEMWLATQIDPMAAGPHHGTNVVHLDGTLDVAALKQAISQIVNRHEAFRCTFNPDGMEVIVSPSVVVDLPVHDLSGLPPADRDARVSQLLDQEARRILDLVTGPLFAFQLIRLSSTEHLLVFTVQMIICDGWGYTVALEEIAAAYSACIEGKPLSLGPAIPMREYVRWQQQQQDSPEAKECEAFWLERFKTLPPPLELPGFKTRPAARSYAGDRQNLRFSPELFSEIKRTAKDLKTTPFAFLLAAYGTWLSRMGGVNDVVIGVPFAGQSGAALEGIVGQCVQTLPLRIGLDPNEPFAGLVDRTKEMLFDAQEHWNYSFGKVVQKLSVPSDPSRIPLVSVTFNLDLPLTKVQFAGCRQHIQAGPRRYYQYDLGFNVVNEGSTLLVECDYNSNLFEADLVEQWLLHFQTLLEGIVANPREPLRHLPLLSAKDRQQRALEWNASSREFSRNATVHGLVSAQAARTPDAVAVEWERQKLSYEELERRSNQVANLLRSLGIGPDAVAGVCVERTPAMVIALLGILKAGGAYVPIDPDLPTERIAAMLANADAPVLLTQGSLLSRLPVTKARMICLDEDHDVIDQQSPELAPAATGPSNLAYVIYTSGSTGEPKGVEITHGSLVNFLESMQRVPGMKVDDAILALTTISFDIAALELFLPLTIGGRTVIVTRDVMVDPQSLSRKIVDHGVTMMQATPATWRMLLNAGWIGDPKLKVLCGGESLPPDLAKRLLACGGELWNMYGPTETTVWSTCGRVQSGDAITIGRPIANTQVHILDDDRQPVPVGVAGELVIGGLGLARGYRNLPEITAEKFIPDPTGAAKPALVYRTGDLARRNLEGEIQIIGRVDFQVKIRGHRIELGEIESVLLSHPRVRETVVVMQHDGADSAKLVAYVASDDNQVPPGSGSNASSLRAELRQLIRAKLPAYMLPAAFVVLPELPHSPTGKMDRDALPPPRSEDTEAPSLYVAPRDPTEGTLARIWSETLKINRVGIRDSFFALGGQSLLAVALFSKIEQAFGKKLPLATLFRAPTIEQLALALKSKLDASAQWSSLVPIQPHGAKPPLFLVHGAGGNVLLYRLLAEHLAPDYPIYGLQSRGLDGNSEPLHTIEEMAVEYLREMRTIQGKGPYYLGGYCLGGTVAYEIAQILHQEGEEVALIAMLDTYNFSRALKSSFAGFVWQKARFHFGNFVHLRPKEMWRYVREKARVAHDGELANILTSRPGSASEEGVARATSGVEASVQAINDHAAEVYLPKHLAGRLTLFKPHANYKFYPDPNMGWGDLVLGLDVVEVSTNPHAMLVEPYVRQLAAELKSRLDRVQAPTAVAPLQPA